MASKLAFAPASLDALNRGTLKDPLTPGLMVEVLASGKKRWKYRRRITRSSAIVTLTFDTYPSVSIAAAREWARVLNEQVEAGRDPREVKRAREARSRMTVERAHALYMEAVREGRASSAKRPNKPGTVAHKLAIYKRDIAPKLGTRIVYALTEDDLIDLVVAKGKRAKVRANRLAAELKVFFGWAASLRGREVGLPSNIASRLGDLRFAEKSRSRKLSLEEIGWFLRALVAEEFQIRRGMLLWLLTAARISEVVRARRTEVAMGIWTIPPERTKNSIAHRIELGPWGRSLMEVNSEWIFPSSRVDGPQTCGWYKARDRVKARMTELAGRPIEHFTPHDFRRTVRSNTKRLKVDRETAEAMLNHVKPGLDRTYDHYELEDEKRDWFFRWEREIIRIALAQGVAEQLGISQDFIHTTAPRDAAVPVGVTRAQSDDVAVFRIAPQPLPLLSAAGLVCFRPIKT